MLFTRPLAINLNPRHKTLSLGRKSPGQPDAPRNTYTAWIVFFFQTFFFVKFPQFWRSLFIYNIIIHIQLYHIFSLGLVDIPTAGGTTWRAQTEVVRPGSGIFALQVMSSTDHIVQPFGLTLWKGCSDRFVSVWLDAKFDYWPWGCVWFTSDKNRPVLRVGPSRPTGQIVS